MSTLARGYVRPCDARISSDWADHRNRRPPSQEPGTDYACAYGTTIRSAHDGVVVEVKNTTTGAMGRFVTIDLGDGYRVRYLHLSTISVKVGDRVRRGDTIAKSGASAWGFEWGVGAHVHASAWTAHHYVFGPDGTVDFERLIGEAATLRFSQTVADRQRFLNENRGEKLVVDGYEGGFTKAAYGRYQTFLASRGWYKGKIDQDWGPQTQAAHEIYWRELHRAVPTGRASTVADIRKLPNTRGLQKIAKLYGYTGPLDNDFGPGSQRGLQRFLDQNHGGSLAGWLRARWGYRDRDDIWGPNQAAAATRADTANWRAL